MAVEVAAEVTVIAHVVTVKVETTGLFKIFSENLPKVKLVFETSVLLSSLFEGGSLVGL